MRGKVKIVRVLHDAGTGGDNTIELVFDASIHLEGKIFGRDKVEGRLSLGGKGVNDVVTSAGGTQPTDLRGKNIIISIG